MMIIVIIVVVIFIIKNVSSAVWIQRVKHCTNRKDDCSQRQRLVVRRTRFSWRPCLQCSRASFMEQPVSRRCLFKAIL